MRDNRSLRKISHWSRRAGATALFAGLAFSTFADAAVITVGAADNIYGAGQALTPGGNSPQSIAIASVNDFVTFGVTGTITLNGSNNFNNADGANSGVASSSDTGYNGLSGIVAPGAGYLVGVFLTGAAPAAPAPAALDFSGGTSFASLSPLLYQVFFIGDGLTGNGTGAVQKFVIPTGATRLFLGISDACAYTGPPGCYFDNFGSYTVSYTLDVPSGGSTGATGSAPEPATVLSLLSGVAVLGLAGVRGRKQQA